MKNKLLYFGLLVVTLYLAILYDSPMLLGFGLMEMVLPVISGILMLWTAAHMKAQIYLLSELPKKSSRLMWGADRK